MSLQESFDALEQSIHGGAVHIDESFDPEVVRKFMAMRFARIDVTNCSNAWLDDVLPENGKVEATIVTSVTGEFRLENLAIAQDIEILAANTVSFPNLHACMNLDIQHGEKLDLPRLMVIQTINAKTITGFHAPEMQLCTSLFLDAVEKLFLPKLGDGGHIFVENASNVVLPDLTRAICIQAKNAIYVQAPRSAVIGILALGQDTELSCPMNIIPESIGQALSPLIKSAYDLHP